MHHNARFPSLPSSSLGNQPFRILSSGQHNDHRQEFSLLSLEAPGARMHLHNHCFGPKSANRAKPHDARLRTTESGCVCLLSANVRWKRRPSVTGYIQRGSLTGEGLLAAAAQASSSKGHLTIFLTSLQVEEDLYLRVPNSLATRQIRSSFSINQPIRSPTSLFYSNISSLTHLEIVNARINIPSSKSATDSTSPFQTMYGWVNEVAHIRFTGTSPASSN